MTDDMPPGPGIRPAVPAGKPTEHLPLAGTTTQSQPPRIGSLSVVSRDLADFGTPGVWVEVDPDVAEEMGAFEETALSVEDVEGADDGN